MKPPYDRVRSLATWLANQATALPVAPARVDWTNWPAALPALLPPVLVSLLFAGRLAEWPGLEGLTFRLLGLLLIGGCLAATLVVRWLNWPGQLAALSTAATLGLVVPALALHLPLARRVVADPVPIVVAPALASLSLLAAAMTVVVGLVLACRPAPTWVGPSLLPAASLSVWPIPLVWQPDEAIVWAAVAVTFALAAVVWLVAGLIGGWLIVLPPTLGLVVTWLFALSLPVTEGASPRAGGLLGAQLALALAASLLVLLLPVVLAGWRARRARSI